jgi:3-oxoacyl-[acyl-carrier protein] reductase
MCGRDRERLEAAAREIGEATGAEVIAIPADVSTREGAEGFVRQGAEALGGCQILVPNVGGPPTGTFDELSDEGFAAAFESLFQSAARMTREALPHMRRAGYGRVVLVGSSAMKQPIPGLMLSNSMRAGVAGWARTLATELGPEGITVNVVVPGRILTDRIRVLAENRARRSGRGLDDALAEEAAQVPMGRLGEPRDVGDLIAYLASERAAYLTGCFVHVDGGLYRGLF